MAVITITAYNVPLVQSGDSSLLLRLSCNENYTTYEGVDIVAGDGSTGSWYREYSCPVTSNVAAVPEVSIYATEDRTTGQDPRWTGTFYDPTGTQVRGYLFPYGLRITATPLTTSWGAIAVFNCLPPQLYIYGYFNSNQSDARYPQLDGLTADVVPKVSTVSPPAFVDSLFSDDDVNADIDISGGGMLRFGGAGALDPGIKRIANGLELRNAGDTDFQTWRSGGTLTNFGQLDTTTVDCNTTATQTLFTTDAAHPAVVTSVILRSPTTNLAVWVSTIALGRAGGSEWWVGNAGDLAFAQLDALNFLPPLVGARIVPVGTAFTIKFGTVFGSAGFFDVDSFGYLL